MSKYLIPWARILGPHADQLAYLDLYSGPGRFDDGTESTPLLILRQAISTPVLRAKLVTVFNDENSEFTERLEREVNNLEGIETLQYRPMFLNQTVDDSLTSWFSEHRAVPVLSFLDPWGYKGISRRLLQSVIRDFGCEAIFFFNYNRINAAIQNNLVEPLMAGIFGQERLARLRTQLPNLRPAEREHLVLRQLGEVIDDLGAGYMIPFRFLREPARQAHYIFHATKHPLGYEIMKEIMAGLGVKDIDGVPKFEYIPRRPGVQLAFEIDRPILALPNALQNFSEAGH